MTNQLTLNTNPFTGNQSDDIGRICVDYNADGSMSFDAHSQKRVEVDGEKINIGNLESMYSQSYASYEEMVAKAANLILVSEGRFTPEEIQEALSGNNAEL